MRLSRFALAIGFVLLLTASLRTALAADDAGAFIGKTSNEVLTLLNDPQVAQAQFAEKLKTIAHRDFDVPRIARFVVGRYWRSASDAERQQFVQAFETYMVSVYAQRFAQYRGSVSFKVTGQHQEGDVSMVTTEIARSTGQPPAKVIWQVNKGADGYKITDVSIEGVSQAVTYREEFDSVISQHGGQLSALTQELRQKASG